VSGRGFDLPGPNSATRTSGAHLAAAAYPILEGRGELLLSRLRQDMSGVGGC